MKNKISIKLKSISCNGYPKVKIIFNNKILYDITLETENHIIDFYIKKTVNFCTLQIERYGKNYYNMVIENGCIIKDQILKIEEITVDGIKIPDFILGEESNFKFEDQIHKGSTYFGPNGLWTFKFKSPIITWILDKKIKNETKYGNDHLLPFSYKINLEEIDNYLYKLNTTLEKIKKNKHV